MLSSKTVRIMVAYHEPATIIKNDIVIPIHVGRAVLKSRTDEESVNRLEEMMKFSIGDDTGDNISLKNPSYNEMTAIYWAWKNYKELGDPDYVGLMHYRRLLYNTEEKGAFFEKNSFCNDDINGILKLSKEELLDIFDKFDFISSRPYYRKSVYEHFKENHDIKDLDVAVDILKEKYPEYAESCDRYLSGQNAYFCNMFIFPRKIFVEYCEWIFDILFEFESKVDLVGKRLFISERLTGIYIQHMIDSGKKCKTMPTMYLECGLEIPVVYASDMNYMVPTCTSIVSLLENKNKVTQYDIHVLVPSKDFDDSTKMVEPLISKYKTRITVHSISDFDEAPIEIPHITSPTYYRLALPALLANTPKCIYIDSDTVIEEDLSELFRHNISDFYIAGIKAAGYIYPKENAEKHRKKINIKSMDRYVNAGVLLFNLNKIRKDEKDKVFISLSKKSYPSQDQDIINISCYEAIRQLPLKFNVMTKYLRISGGQITSDDIGASVYDKNEIDEAIRKPAIIHYADKIKPWDSTTAVFAERWRHYNNKYFEVCGKTRGRVSVIIPIYNKEAYLRQCLNSVTNQTLREIEIICINDGSEDGTSEILSEYAKRDDRIIILNQQNSGVSYSRNRGITNATSEFIAFMDPDDYYPSDNTLEILFSAAKSNKVNIAGGSWSEEIDGKIKTEFQGRNKAYVFQSPGVMHYSNYQFDYGFHRFIYSREMIVNKKIIFPPYVRFQDTLFFIKAMVASDKFYATSEPTYRYRLGHQSFEWNDIRCRDVLLGLIDNLRISSRNKLAILHETTLIRINDEYGPKIIEHIRSGSYDQYLIELLIRANTSVDRNLLKDSKLKIRENYCIKPLKDLIKYYHEVNNSSIIDKAFKKTIGMIRRRK